MIWVSLNTQYWMFPSPDSLNTVITLSSCIETARIIDGGDEDEPPPFSASASVSKKCVATA